MSVSKMSADRLFLRSNSSLINTGPIGATELGRAASGNPYCTNSALVSPHLPSILQLIPSRGEYH